MDSSDTRRGATKSSKLVLHSDPPPIDEHHVRLPDQVAQILGATKSHAAGITGKGVRVAVIDSGFFPHPYYAARNYQITLIPTAADPDPENDEYGHGTAQLASLFSLAPDVEALAIKCMDRDPSKAIRKALSLRPDILSCAWGYNIDNVRTKKLPDEFREVHRLLLKAIDQGICVVAAAGNGQRSFPGNMPEVISTGGVFYGTDGKLHPSDVSSAYTSTIFPKRVVPDICGLTGNRPHGRLLLVPAPPRSRLLKSSSFRAIAAGESTELSATALPARQHVRGWAMFSGTSAATAMISGAAALLLQVQPDLTPERIKQLLMENATFVPPDGGYALNVDAAMAALEATAEEAVLLADS